VDTSQQLNAVQHDDSSEKFNVIKEMLRVMKEDAEKDLGQKDDLSPMGVKSEVLGDSAQANDSNEVHFKEAIDFIGSSCEVVETPERPDSIKHLLYTGGGAKGVLYGGVHELLQSTGELANVESVIGVSAGALYGLLATLGLTPEEMRKILRIDVTWLGNIEGMPVGVTGKNFTRLFRAIIRKSFLSHLECNTNVMVSNEELQELYEQLKNDNPYDPEYVLNFGHLATMNQMFPKKFKHFRVGTTMLPMTGNELTGTIEHTEFSSIGNNSLKDFEIACAMRASMALPVVFTYLTFQDGWACDRYIESMKSHEPFRLIDGGVTDNIPTVYYQPSQMKDAVAFKFVKSDTDPNPQWDLNKDKCSGFMNQMNLWRIAQSVGVGSTEDFCNFQTLERVNAREFVQNGGSIVSLNNTGVETTDFEMISRPEVQAKYEAIGRKAMMDYMEERKRQFDRKLSVIMV
jgi:predicted acylesterase/phospholipase RssA